MKRFNELPHKQQVYLAAYMALLASEPLLDGEVVGLPYRYTRAVGEIADTVGLRTRKRINQEARHDRKKERV
jgi:hypothetical protein